MDGAVKEFYLEAAIAAARAAGAVLREERGSLVVQGPATAAPLVEPLLATPGLVLAALAAEDAAVAWRMAAMRPQVPRRGPIPLLVARTAVVPFAAGSCISCGDHFGPSAGTLFRCSSCNRATRAVLYAIREELAGE